MKVPRIPAARGTPALRDKNALNGIREEGTFEILLKRTLSSNSMSAGAPQKASPTDRKETENLIRRMQEHRIALPWHALIDDGADAIPLLGSPEPMLFPLLRQKGLSADGEAAASKLRHEIRQKAGGPTLKDLDRIIDLAAGTYGVNADLIRRVVRAESNFNPRSRSPKGAMGLMQLMPETARELGVQDPYDPVDNVMGGTRYLRGLIDRYQGDTERALAAYNWGMGNVDKYPDRLPAETRRYVARTAQPERKA